MDPIETQQNDGQSNQQNPTDTTPSNNPPARDPALVLLEETIRSQQEQIRLLSQVQNQQPTVTPVPATPPDPREFYENPHQTIRREVAEAIKPLQGFMAQMQRRTDISRVSSMVASAPQYAAIFPHIRNEFEAALETISELNQVSVLQVLQACVGNYALRNINPQGQFTIPNNNNSQQSLPVNAPRNIPAHLQSSAPASNPGNLPAAPKRQYSELERRMMREHHLTEEQFDKLQTAAPYEVLTAEITGLR